MVPVAGWNHYDGDLGSGSAVQSILYTCWRGFEIVFHVAPLLSADLQRQFIGNDKVLIIFTKPKKPLSPVFRGNINAVSVVAQWNAIGHGWRCAAFFRSRLWNFKTSGFSDSLIRSKSVLRDTVLANVINGWASTTSCTKNYKALYGKELDQLVEQHAKQ